MAVDLETENAELRAALRDVLQSHCDGYDLWLYKYQSLLPEGGIIGEQECCLPNREERAENERLRAALESKEAELRARMQEPGYDQELNDLHYQGHQWGIIACLVELREAMEGKT